MIGRLSLLLFEQVASPFLPVLKNMVTIGESELTIINKITSISKEIERIELDNRKKLYLDDIAVLEDMDSW